MEFHLKGDCLIHKEHIKISTLQISIGLCPLKLVKEINPKSLVVSLAISPSSLLLDKSMLFTSLRVLLNPNNIRFHANRNLSLYI